MTITLLKKIAATCLLLSASCISNAALINADYLTAGDGLAVYDTVTGKTWLDLSVTNNIAYNNVNVANYRYATSTEVTDLFDTYWGDLTYNSNGLANESAADAYLSGTNWNALWGSVSTSTFPTSGSTIIYRINENLVSWGLYKNEADQLSMAGVSTTISRRYLNDNGEQLFIDSENSMLVYGSNHKTNYLPFLRLRNPQAGTYLIKVVPDVTPVPVSGSLAFIALGIAALGLRRKRSLN